MKNKKKGIVLALCLVIFAGLALGSGSSKSEDKEIASVSGGASTESSDSTAAAETEESAVSSADVTIEEQVIYNGNDVTITVTGLEDSWLGTDLKLLIENNSTQNVTVQARNASVNGFMVDTWFSADVAAGKKANDTLTFDYSDLKDSGVKAVAVMEFRLTLFDTDTWNDIDLSDILTLETSIADSYVQTVDDSGEVLVDQGGVRIIGKGLSSKDSIWGPGLLLLIENNSGKDITVQTRDVSINGFMVDPLMSEDIADGKLAMTAVEFMSSDLEDNGIEDIEEIELYFTVFDEHTWSDIFDSDVITLTF